MQSVTDLRGLQADSVPFLSPDTRSGQDALLEARDAEAEADHSSLPYPFDHTGDEIPSALFGDLSREGRIVAHAPPPDMRGLFGPA
mgnify:CR=1 FL=1|jgi:hypothetical protein